jgi:hemerythrin superfamily protein
MVHSPRTKKKPMAEKPRTRPSHPSKHSARRTTARAQPDAVSLLRADHKKMRELLKELKSAEKPAQRQRLLAEVKQQMEAHTTIEEELFYPAFLAAARTAKDQQLFYEANAEHNAAKLMLQEVASADDTSEEFPGRAKVLKEVVEHHAEEEETDMFPRVRELIAPAELRALGRQMAERRRTLFGGALQRVAAFLSSSFSSQPEPTPASGA